MAADTTTTEDDDYHRTNEQGQSYRNVYGLTSPREKIYGYDEHGQRKEVVPIREVAGLELIEDKFTYLTGVIEQQKEISDALEQCIINLKKAIDPTATEEEIKKRIGYLQEAIEEIEKYRDPLYKNIAKYKEISIDIKDYPSYL